MAFRNFMYAETDDDLSFLPKDQSADFGTGSPFVSINTKPSVVKVVPIDQHAENTADSEHSRHQEEYVIHLGSVAKRIRERKCRTRGGSSKPLVKRKQAVVDDAVNRRSQELLKIIDQIRTECAVIKEREKARDQECEELKAKYEAAMAYFDKNPSVNILREKIVYLSEEVKEQRANLDRMAEAVSKVVPYVAIELVNNDDIGRLVSKLVSPSILYERCQAFEEVAKINEPFDITKKLSRTPMLPLRFSFSRSFVFCNVLLLQRLMCLLLLFHLRRLLSHLLQCLLRDHSYCCFSIQDTVSSSSSVKATMLVGVTTLPVLPTEFEDLREVNVNFMDAKSYVPRVRGLGYPSILVETRLAASQCGSLSPLAPLWERRLGFYPLY
nr:hypothetical protein [Tanacetum cinerariifolium]